MKKNALLNNQRKWLLLVLVGAQIWTPSVYAGLSECVTPLVELIRSLDRVPVYYPRAAKKYLDSYSAVKTWEYPPMDTLGIEIEGIVDVAINMLPLRDAVAEEMARTESGVNAEIQDTPDFRDIPLVSYERGGRNYTFFFVPDETVEGPVGTRAAEVNSPILRDEYDRTRFLDTVPVLAQAGMREEPQTGGVHFHVGFADPRPGELALLFLVFSAVERDLFRVYGVGPQRAKYCKIMSEHLVRRLGSGRIRLDSSTESLIKVLSPDRKHALNGETVIKYTKTAEFRFMNSTLDRNEIKITADFLRALVRAIRTKNPLLVALLSSMGSRKELTTLELANALELPTEHLEWFKQQSLLHIGYPLPQRMWAAPTAAVR